MEACTKETPRVGVRTGGSRTPIIDQGAEAGITISMDRTEDGRKMALFPNSIETITEVIESTSRGNSTQNSTAIRGLSSLDLRVETQRSQILSPRKKRNSYQKKTRKIQTSLFPKMKKPQISTKRKTRCSLKEVKLMPRNQKNQAMPSSKRAQKKYTHPV